MRTDTAIWNYRSIGSFPIPTNFKIEMKTAFPYGRAVFISINGIDFTFSFIYLPHIVLTAKNIRDTIGTQLKRIYGTDGIVEMTT